MLRSQKWVLLNPSVNSPMRTNVLEYISVLRKQIPTRDELSNLREFPSQKDIRALLSKMLDNVPSNKDIIRLTEELEGAVSRISRVADQTSSTKRGGRLWTSITLDRRVKVSCP